MRTAAMPPWRRGRGTGPGVPLYRNFNRNRELAMSVPLKRGCALSPAPPLKQAPRELALRSLYQAPCRLNARLALTTAEVSSHSGSDRPTQRIIAMLQTGRLLEWHLPADPYSDSFLSGSSAR